jgi:hypothetical protein
MAILYPSSLVCLARGNSDFLVATGADPPLKPPVAGLMRRIAGRQVRPWARVLKIQRMPLRTGRQ